MTRHSLYDAFDHVDHEPTAAFRDGLRAQLLDELVASGAATDSALGDPRAHDDDQRTAGDQNVLVVGDSGPDRQGRPRYRIMLAAAAATIVIVGAGALLLERSGGPDKVTTVTTPETVPSTTTAPTTTTAPAPTTTVPSETVPEAAPATVPTIDDEALVADALVESQAIGAGTNITQLQMTTEGRPDTWASTNEAFAAEPACAEHTATMEPLLADATGTRNLWTNSGTYNRFISSVAAYADLDAASQAMDAVEAPSYPDCFIAVLDAFIEAEDPDRNEVVSTLIDAAPFEQHGDRQVSFAVSTSSTGFAPSPTIFHVIAIRYDRLVLSIIVNEDSLGPDARFGITQASIRAAVGAIEDALGIG